MLSTIIAKIGLPFLISLIGGALGSVNNPVAQSASKALQNFEGAMADGSVTADEIAEGLKAGKKAFRPKEDMYGVITPVK